jgi:1-acyl-sn-glycerol-3-phosphate acyltransferase
MAPKLFVVASNHVASYIAGVISQDASRSLGLESTYHHTFVAAKSIRKIPL